jgi:hypothetical protein
MRNVDNLLHPGIMAMSVAIHVEVMAEYGKKKPLVVLWYKNLWTNLKICCRRSSFTGEISFAGYNFLIGIERGLICKTLKILLFNFYLRGVFARIYMQRHI